MEKLFKLYFIIYLRNKGATGCFNFNITVTRIRNSLRLFRWAAISKPVSLGIKMIQLQCISNQEKKFHEVIQVIIYFQSENSLYKHKGNQTKVNHLTKLNHHNFKRNSRIKFTTKGIKYMRVRDSTK